VSQTRRLVAILAADVAGYSRLIGANEGGTLRWLASVRAELTDPKIAEHHGRIVKTMGDGLLVEFASVIDALRCAVEVQTAMAERNTAVAADDRIEFRIGINVGDVVVEDGDIFGDGVNVAARLEGLAEPGGICVSARVQEDAAGRLDLTFEDLGEQQLKNIARPVRVYHVLAAGNSSAVTRPALALPDKPSIAVLPFANMSGDPEQEYFADGMVEEIITALGRIRWLFVIARNSTFTYKGQPVDVKEVGRELGVRYVLEGSVRFDGSLEDVFELQDKVAIGVAAVIEPTLEASEIDRSGRRPTNDLTAYDLYLRALPILLSFPSRERVLEAFGLLDHAIARDPGYGPALALVSFGYVRFYDWGEAPDADRRKVVECARRALAAADDDPGVLATAAFALAFFGEDIGTQIAFVDRALALNPSFARGWYLSGPLRVWAGQPELAIEHVERSLRLSPRDRRGSHF